MLLVIEADIQDNVYTVSQFPCTPDTMRVKKITVKFPFGLIQIST